jgi:hypothetical protein
LQDFADQQAAAAATFSFLHKLYESLTEPGPAAAPPATALIAILDQTLSVSWDELRGVTDARGAALTHAAARTDTIAQMRSRYLDEAHAVHPLLQRLMPTADRLSRVDFGSVPVNGPDSADLRGVALTREEYAPRLRALRHAEAVLCLYGTRGIASGFLAADDIGSLFSSLSLTCCVLIIPSPSLQRRGGSGCLRSSTRLDRHSTMPASTHDATHAFAIRSP